MITLNAWGRSVQLIDDCDGSFQVVDVVTGVRVWITYEALIRCNDPDLVDRASVELTVKMKADDLDDVASHFGYWLGEDRCIQDLIVDGIVTYPLNRFTRDELRVWIYERMSCALSSKQTRDALYRLRVLGWPITHHGLGNYSVGI